MTIRATNGLKIVENVVFDTMGHGFYLANGNEVRN